MASKPIIKWLAASEDQDYPAAGSYLRLIYDSKTVAKLSRKLKKAPVSEFKAKDSSGIPTTSFSAATIKIIGVNIQSFGRIKWGHMVGWLVCLFFRECATLNIIFRFDRTIVA